MKKIVISEQKDGRWYGQRKGSDDGHGNEIDSLGDTPYEALERLLNDGETIRERVFLLTDTCMWEKNRKEGTYHPHAVEVVDVNTGQTRFIKSGAKIAFVEGDISKGRSQEDYNRIHEEN